VIGIVVGSLLSLYHLFFTRLEKIDIPRLPKMSLSTFERIKQENQFERWDRKIFFKEYLPDDNSSIWFVTASFQSCDVEASFRSIPNKLLSLEEESVSFRSSGHLSGHLLELSKFEFDKGRRIIPGLYEVDIRATQCHWGSLPAKIKNFWRPVESNYFARTKVVLFSRGPLAFTNNLNQLLKKKEQKILREKSQNEAFWDDLQQKLETLLAVALQIEQHLLDHVGRGPGKFRRNLNSMVGVYTRKFGSFLTSFVIENGNDFRIVSKGISQKRNYELLVRLSAKNIGLESMKFIEEFQRQKKDPPQEQLSNYGKRIRATFSLIKKDLTEKLSQVDKDRTI
jgi:hypothetical protein